MKKQIFLSSLASFCVCIPQLYADSNDADDCHTGGFISSLFPRGCTGSEGPVGPTGPAGPTGVTGADGPTGPAGATGTAGQQGPTGDMGPTGVTGAQGPTGEQGPTGVTGVDGPTGPAGATGTTGAQGPTGVTGEQGSTGPTGFDGPTGPTGAVGAQGVVGPTGAEGPAGATGSAGPTGVTGADGPTGPAGEPGATGPQGVTGPTGTANIGAYAGLYSVEMQIIEPNGSAASDTVHFEGYNALMGGIAIEQTATTGEIIFQEGGVYHIDFFIKGRLAQTLLTPLPWSFGIYLDNIFVPGSSYAVEVGPYNDLHEINGGLIIAIQPGQRLSLRNTSNQRVELVSMSDTFVVPQTAASLVIYKLSDI
jgi:hypothetical protein